MCVQPLFIPYSENGLGFGKGKPLHGLYAERIKFSKKYVLKSGQMGIYVPCGKCPECYEARQRQWYARFSLEKIYWEKKGCLPYFLTFTYNNEHLPESREKAVLDIQAFSKQLGRKLGFKPRFYFTSENGEENNRLHFHGLIFNVPFQFVRNRLIEEILESCWHRGFINCQVASGKTFNYVSKYVTKDIDVTKKDCWKTIQVFSKRPALGLPAKSNKSLSGYLNNCDVPCLHFDGFSYPLPRYLRTKLLSDEKQLKLKSEFILKHGINPDIKKEHRQDVWHQYYLKCKELKNLKKKKSYEFKQLNKFLGDSCILQERVTKTED